jgi:hypothetical protein
MAVSPQIALTTVSASGEKAKVCSDTSRLIPGALITRARAVAQICTLARGEGIRRSD